LATDTDEHLRSTQTAVDFELHDTTWDHGDDPISGDALPSWWLIHKRHYQGHVDRFASNCDKLLEELARDEPRAMKVIDYYADMERGLGRIHGILGKLPVHCHLPGEVHRKYVQAASSASLWLRERIDAFESRADEEP